MTQSKTAVADNIRERRMPMHDKERPGS